MDPKDEELIQHMGLREKIRNYADQVGASDEEVELAIDIAEEIVEEGLSGRSAKSFAAGSLWAARSIKCGMWTDIHPTQINQEDHRWTSRDLAEAVGTQRGTLRDNRDFILNALPRCPNCESKNIEAEEKVEGGISTYYNEFICQDCGEDWRIKHRFRKPVNMRAEE